MTVYGDYTRSRIGWFFGLSGWQLALLAVAVLPVAVSVSRKDWLASGVFVALWAFLYLVVAVPVRGRSMTGWIGATLRLAWGTLTGWTRFRARAATGRAVPEGEVDLPGVLQSVVIHEGPPTGHQQHRIALIQNNAARTWAVTASIVHPG